MIETINIILVVLIWYTTGILGFIFWWTRTDEFTKKELPVMFFAGLGGLYSWGLGYLIHGIGRSAELNDKEKKR